jgi:hypothetical protein
MRIWLMAAPSGGERLRHDTSGHPSTFARIPFAAYRFRPELPASVQAPLAALALAQGCSLAACLARFRRLPRYRTSAYRWSAGAVGLGLAGHALGGLPGLALRPVLWLLVWAHLEALAITLTLAGYREPVRSLRAFRRTIDGRA